MTVETQIPPPPPAPAPGPVITRVDWAPVPKVNLLPPEILQARQFRQLQRRLAVVVLAVVVLAGGAVVWAQSGISSAEQDLAATQAQGARLKSQQATLAQVPQTLAELDAARTAREQALGTDVAWYRFLDDLALNIPTGTQLSAVEVALADPGAASTGSGGTSSPALTPTGIGDVQIKGKALKFTDIAAWLDASSQVRGLTGPSLQTATRKDSDGSGPDEIDYTLTAVITQAALSHRYDRKAS